ncbi:YkvA family protein [Aestuariivirga sp.]|uniref:YkvA family protein n=1 Tax=Aestuariivirga sp. TaxID=2650926 RepID=UPI0039E72396
MVVTRNEEKVKRGFFPKLARVLASLPMASEVVAGYYAAFDSATPLKAKAILLAALAYFIMPFDAVPDFIVGLGFTDDMAVLMTAFSLVTRHITEAHRARARATVERIRRGETVTA